MMNTKDPIDVLSRVIWGEARNQGRAGMAAVASVVLNRVADPCWWGHDIISVCLHPEQFSCLNPGDPNREKLMKANGADPAFVTAGAVATLAVDGRLKDTTNGADSYYVTGTPEPAWAHGLVPCAIIGAHRFYRTRPPMPKLHSEADALMAAEEAQLGMEDGS